MEKELQILEERIAHLHVLYQSEKRSTMAAMKLQAKEYKRRLKGLNNEARQLKEMQGKYIPREVFEQFEKVTLLEIAQLREWKSTMNGKIAVYSVIIVVIIPVIMWALDYFKE